MKTVRMAVAVGMLTVFAWAACAQPPPPGPGQGARRERRQAMTPEQRLDALADRLGLTSTEKSRVQTALKAKMEARQALREALSALREAVRDPNLKDAQAKAALDKFNRTLEAYRAKVRSIDARLAKSVSTKTRAKLTANGVIDNGTGLGMLMGRRPGGMPRGMRPRRER